jgi:hypothetical protein
MRNSVHSYNDLAGDLNLFRAAIQPDPSLPLDLLGQYKTASRRTRAHMLHLQDITGRHDDANEHVLVSNRRNISSRSRISRVRSVNTCKTKCPLES